MPLAGTSADGWWDAVTRGAWSAIGVGKAVLLGLSVASSSVWACQKPEGLLLTDQGCPERTICAMDHGQVLYVIPLDDTVAVPPAPSGTTYHWLEPPSERQVPMPSVTIVTEPAEEGTGGFQ